MNLETDMDTLYTTLGTSIRECSKTTATAQIEGMYDTMIRVPISKHTTVEFM